MAREIDALSTKLKQTSLESPTEIPFGLYANDAFNQLRIPRYLFRVFSARSAGQNDKRWMKSLDAESGNLTDIFERYSYDVAITLNQHLDSIYWRPKRDPFISWTASLAFALQYAIYKHKSERLSMDKIQLCVIDTTDFSSGTFVSDLVLMRQFQSKVKDETLIDVQRYISWRTGGLPSVLYMRTRNTFESSGTYYWGEYLAQGQLWIENRSCVVSCDKVITEDLLRMVPVLRVNLEEPRLYWAKATLQLREPFYAPERAEVISDEDVLAIKKITWRGIPERWIVVMFTSLLGLYPRRMENLGFVSELLDSISDEILDKCLSQKTIIDTSRHMPEVLQFGQLIDAVYKEYTSRRHDKLLQSMQSDIVRIQDILRSLDRRTIDKTPIQVFAQLAQDARTLLASLENLR